MKHKYYAYLLVLGVFLFSSCLKEEESLFDKSSAERLIEAQAKYEAILKAPKNGWLMDYYCGGQGENRIGGYQIICQFGDNGSVTMAGTYTTGSYTTLGQKVESSYVINRMQGPCLSFSTYNTVLHPFGDPRSDTDENGYTGDFEFVILEASAEKVTMRGIRQRQIVVLRPMAEDKDWVEYCAEAETVRTAIQGYTRFEIRKAGNSAGYFTMWTVDSQVHDADNRGDNVIITNYTITNTGIRLYEALEIGGVTIEHLVWDFDNFKFTDIDASTNVEITPTTIRFEQLLGTYSVTCDNFTTPVLVQIRDKGDGKTLRVSSEFLRAVSPDLDYEFDIEVYDNNRMGIVSQTIGTANGNFIKLAVATKALIFGGLLTSSGYNNTAPYNGSWYRSAPTNPELRFLKSTTETAYVSTTFLGVRVCEFSVESGVSTGNLVATRSAIISSPVFIKK